VSRRSASSQATAQDPLPAVVHGPHRGDDRLPNDYQPESAACFPKRLQKGKTPASGRSAATVAPRLWSTCTTDWRATNGRGLRCSSTSTGWATRSPGAPRACSCHPWRRPRPRPSGGDRVSDPDKGCTGEADQRVLTFAGQRPAHPKIEAVGCGALSWRRVGVVDIDPFELTQSQTRRRWAATPATRR
jgi:hypothetical protein